MQYECVKTHYHPDDRAMPRGKRRVIKVGDRKDFTVPPRSNVWKRASVGDVSEVAPQKRKWSK